MISDHHFRQWALVNAVLGRPGEAALAQPAVLQQRAHLVVAQGRDAEVRAREPAPLACIQHLPGRDGERRI
jgi:hypothetical protein